MAPLMAIRRRISFLTTASSAQVKRAVLISVIVFAGVLLFAQNYAFYLDTQSVSCFKERFFFGEKANKDSVYQKGQIVSFLGNEHVMLGLFNGERIAKKIIGVPGDVIVTKLGFLYINGDAALRLNPTTLQKIAKRGKTPIEINKTLEKDEYVVAADADVSFDSRYWGTLHSFEIDKKLWALL